jgi:hypothetical protein
MAEGEELGSNLLPVTQSSLGDPGGLARFFEKTAAGGRSQQPQGGPADTPARWLHRP